MVVYQRVDVLIGRPIWITSAQRDGYKGRQARSIVADLKAECQSEITGLLRYGQ